jgi:hypothetical protein
MQYMNILKRLKEYLDMEFEEYCTYDDYYGESDSHRAGKE